MAELRQLALLCIPTVFDLVATVLMNVGLLSVTASVYQMMRGAEMLFAALFTLVFLGRELNRKHMCGILCCVVCHPGRSTFALFLLGCRAASSPLLTHLCRCPLQHLVNSSNPDAWSTSMLVSTARMAGTHA